MAVELWLPSNRPVQGDIRVIPGEYFETGIQIATPEEEKRKSNEFMAGMSALGYDISALGMRTMRLTNPDVFNKPEAERLFGELEIAATLMHIQWSRERQLRNVNEHIAAAKLFNRITRR